MNKFEFESEFVDTNNQVLKIVCKSENKLFTVLIDTYDVSYTLYYSCLNIMDRDEQYDFENQIFDYLEEKYSNYFCN